MKLASILGIRGARDKPKDSYGSTAGCIFGRRMCCISQGLGLTGRWGILLSPWRRMRWDDVGL